MKRLLHTLHRLKRWLQGRLGISTSGVQVLLFNPEGELLLIRNSYGRTQLYVFPGGGIRAFEAPEAAALREVREEVGIRAERLAPVSIYRSRTEGRRDTVHLFSAFTTAVPVADGFEVEEARFFALDRLPDTVSPSTLRRILEYKGERPIEPLW